MKDILLRLAVSFLVTISANEISNVNAAGGYDAQKPREYPKTNGGRRGEDYQSNSGLIDVNKKQFLNEHPQQVFPNHLQLAAESEGKLTTTFMAVIGKDIPVNFIINPFGVWTITAMIYGVASGETANQLASVLGISDPASLESAYSIAYNAIQKDTAAVETQTVNMVARLKKKKFQREFTKRLQNVYKAKEIEVDSFAEPQAAKEINKWVADATKDRITNIVTPDELRRMTVVMATACFFKGRWKYPFNKTVSFTDDFKDENDISLGSVRMMRSREMYKNGYNSELQTQVIELPYGDGNTSMLVFMPRRKVSLLAVLEQMRGKSLNSLIPDMTEEEVDLSFPSFTTESSMPLNRVYSLLKADKMLNSGAELPGLSDQEYISKIHHKAEIETSEEGTTASAVTSVQVGYKVSAASFHANRPFVYFINHTPTRLVLFAGRFATPQ